MSEDAKGIDIFLKITSHILGIGSWGLLNYLIYLARTNKVNYGRVIVNFNKYGEMDIETIIYLISLLFQVGYSIWDLIKYFKEHY